jgi:hypothetical protein
MPILERTASREKLAALLAEGHESEQLDYKDVVDLSTDPGEWEMARDIAAMEALGGYIVVGADNSGVLTGRLTTTQADLLDEARLRAKMRKYLTPPLDLLAGCYQMEPSKLAACIYVGPNPGGFRILSVPGNYRAGCPFRHGEVFVRHGTASERWDQSDVEPIIERIVTKRKDAWRRERADDDRARSMAAGFVVAGQIEWTLDAATFQERIVQALRSDDLVSLQLAINTMVVDAAGLHAGKSQDDLHTLLQRLACVGTTAASLKRVDAIEMSAKALARIFAIAPAGSPEAPALWLEVASRVEAIGSVAVRQAEWESVRALALLPAGESYSRFVLRHAVTQAGRAGLLFRAAKLHGLVSVARVAVDEEPCLRPEVPAGDELILDSLCQFDFLAVLAAIDEMGSTDTRYYYTNFAAYYTRRVEQLVVALVRHERVRDVIYPRPDAELAEALATIDRLAAHEAFQYGGWDGFTNREITSFLRAHLKNPS